MFTRFEEELEEYLWMVMVTKREKGFKTDEEAEKWLKEELNITWGVDKE